MKTNLAIYANYLSITRNRCELAFSNEIHSFIQYKVCDFLQNKTHGDPGIRILFYTSLQMYPITTSSKSSVGHVGTKKCLLAPSVANIFSSCAKIS